MKLFFVFICIGLFALLYIRRYKEPLDETTTTTTSSTFVSQIGASSDPRTNGTSLDRPSDTNTTTTSTDTTTTSNTVTTTNSDIETCNIIDKIPCMADSGSNIGDKLCCSQEGTVKTTEYNCPASVPFCHGYICGVQYGTCEKTP